MLVALMFHEYESRVSSFRIVIALGRSVLITVANCCLPPASIAFRLVTLTPTRGQCT